jgi:hypothetical protein
MRRPSGHLLPVGGRAWLPEQNQFVSTQLAGAPVVAVSAATAVRRSRAARACLRAVPDAVVISPGRSAGWLAWSGMGESRRRWYHAVLGGAVARGRSAIRRRRPARSWRGGGRFLVLRASDASSTDSASSVSLRLAVHLLARGDLSCSCLLAIRVLRLLAGVAALRAGGGTTNPACRGHLTQHPVHCSLWPCPSGAYRGKPGEAQPALRRLGSVAAAWNLIRCVCDGQRCGEPGWCRV